MGDLWYLALAYGVIWMGLLAYLFRLAQRAESLRRELHLLRQMLQADPATATVGASRTVAPAAAAGADLGGEA